MKSKFTVGLILSFAILIVFVYLAFIGLVHIFDGDIKLSAICSFLFLLIISGLILLMCIAKNSRWERIRSYVQYISASLCFIFFIVAAIPFTNFMRVCEQSNDFNKDINILIQSAKDLDNEYEHYVDNRLNLLSHNIESTSLHKNTFENECIARSLERHLRPFYNTNIMVEREKWINDINKFSVLNPLSVANINKLISGVEFWSNNYTVLSQFRLSLEEKGADFKSEKLDNSIKLLLSEFIGFHSPTVAGIFISLIVFGIVLIPWILTSKNASLGETDFGEKRGNKCGTKIVV